MADRRKAKKMNRAATKAEYLSTLPKERWKRIAYRLQPKRVAAFWFSREGGVMALKLIGVGIVICFFLTVGLFAYFRKDLPKIKDISGSNLGGSITYYDKSGQTVLWQDYDAVKRIPVKDDQISDYLKHATIAVEDKNFYTGGAFDIRGIMRAAIHDVTNVGGPVQGGSTITQQLVKLNEDWTNDRTISRKVKELILAVELEREYTKQEILTGYLNMAPYGGVEYGAEAAARQYFQTDAKNLSLAQASMLAAIPKSPTRLSPYSSTQFNPAASNKFDQDGLIGRQRYILDQMVDQGYITKAQADEAKQVDVLAQVKPRTSKYNDIKAPYFVLAAKQELQEKYGANTVARGGWKVTTTLDMDLQTKAEDLVAKNQKNVERYGGDNQAVVATDVKTGQMVALVGGYDFNNPDYGKINYAQLNISPGSSFKPYDYASFIENRTDAGAGSVLYDSQGPLLPNQYQCTVKTRKTATDKSGNCLFDYDFKYPGATTLRYALGGSRNVPAVKAMISAVPTDKSKDRVKSINKVIGTANSLIGNDNAYKCYVTGTNVQEGTKADQKQCFASSAIGDGAYIHLDEHVNGLASLARGGEMLPQTYILNITDSAGKTIHKWTQPKPKEIIRPDSAYIVNDILSDPKASYMSTQYKQHTYGGWRTAYKTGTTNDNFDGMMTGWNTQYAIASWVGDHTRNKALTGGHMEYMTAPLTQGLMKAALDKTGGKPVDWQKPTGMKSLNAYVQRTHVGASSIEPGPTQELFPSWYVGKAGTKASASTTIDKVSGGTATSCTPAAAKQTVGGANDNSFSADDFYPIGKSSSSSTTTTTAAADTVHNCDDAKPSLTLTAPSTCGPQACNILAVPGQGTHPLGGGSFGGTVSVSVNGAVIGTQNVSESGSTLTFTYTPTTTGPVTVTATVTDSVLYETTTSATVNTVASAPQATIGNTQNANVASTQRGSQPTTSGSGGRGNDTNENRGRQNRDNRRG
jgi:penicillin-binding protein 1A